MELWHCIFSARKDLECSFHRYGGPLKLVHATLSDRKAYRRSFTAMEVQ